MRVHAVASIVPGATGTVTASYTYDANGNMLTGRGRTVTWTSFDMVDEIVQGTNSVAFTYDSEHARLKQVSSDGATKTYLNDPTSGAMAEKIVGASLSVTWNDYVMLGGEMIALKVSGATTQTRYFHKDHLGSIVALTDETGAVVERSSFDAWGQRRSALGEDDPLYPGQSITSQITRGFTGHEQLDTVGLVHMNGRIYEPVIGKMMSADPTVPNPVDGQSYNRYSYVLNNPLSLTDPTGFQPDPPRGIQRDRGNGIGRDGQIGKSTPAHKSTRFSTRREMFAARLRLGIAWQLFMSSGDTVPLDTYNQIAQASSDWTTDVSDFMFGPGVSWDTYDYWGAYLKSPMGLLTHHGPQALAGGVGLVMGGLEKACGACFDPALAMSLNGMGPIGMLPAAGVRTAQWSWQKMGWGARVLGGVGPTGQFYSVAFEMRLSPTSYPGVSRGAHFQAANDALLQAMEADLAFAQGMQSLGINLQRTPSGLAPRTSPSGWSWHHAEEPGVMDLVPRSQHAPGSIFQDALHPNGQGGYSIWGR